MEYLQLISQQPQNKIALITDERSLTYGDLVAEATAIRQQIDYSEKAHFIHEDKICQQLLQFLAYSGTAVRPIIATEASKKQQFDITSVPKAACMGVMTSGSTGKSKLLWRDYHSWADFFPEQNRVFHVDENTVCFCQGSLAFTGNLNIYMGVLAAGATIVCTERFRPKHWLELIEKHQVNTIYLIPSKLLLLPKFMNGVNERIISIISGSQSMGRVEADKLLAVFPKVEITLYYGASELNYITYIKDCEMNEDRTDIGRPFKGVGISVQGEEIFVDTPYHIEGITIPFSLKDRGAIDEQGRLHFLGRTDDICSVNGLKISTTKVEGVLMELPEVREVAVLSVHVGDADVLTAYMAAEREFSKGELVKLLKNTCLDEHEWPKQLVFLESLPKNESGKIDKRTLQKRG